MDLQTQYAMGDCAWIILQLREAGSKPVKVVLGLDLDLDTILEVTDTG